jgi:hypothetical protein
MTDHLNIAMLGSKFMGRAHSNAWLSVPRFFDVAPTPQMHTVAARNVAQLEEFAAGGVGRGRPPTGSLPSPMTTSDSSTSRPPITSTPNRRSRPSRRASTSPARSHWQARWLTPRRWLLPPPGQDREPSSGSTTAGSRPSPWRTARRWGSARTGSITCGRTTSRAGAGPTLHSCGASRVTSRVPVPTAISMLTSSTPSASSRVRRSSGSTGRSNTPSSRSGP